MEKVQSDPMLILLSGNRPSSMVCFLEALFSEIPVYFKN